MLVDVCWFYIWKLDRCPRSGEASLVESWGNSTCEPFLGYKSRTSVRLLLLGSVQISTCKGWYKVKNCELDLVHLIISRKSVHFT